MPTPTQLRPATLNDIDALISLGRRTFIETYKGMGDERPEGLEEQYGRETFNRERLQPMLALAAGDAAVLFEVAIVGGTPAGFMRLDFDVAPDFVTFMKPAQLSQAYVLKEFQGRGIGRLMINRAQGLARQRGCDGLWLGVYDKNAAGIRFYERMGFTHVGSQPWVFTHGGARYEDTDLVMVKTLG